MGTIVALPRKKNVSGIDEAAPAGSYLYLVFDLAVEAGRRRVVHCVRLAKGLVHGHVKDSFGSHRMAPSARTRLLGGGYLFLDEKGHTIVIGGSSGGSAIMFSREPHRGDTVAILEEAFPGYFVREMG